MKELKRLVVVSERYPTQGEPVFTFVDELLVQLNALGVDLQVISPASITKFLVRGGEKRPQIWHRDTPSGGFTVRQRPYLTTGKLFPSLNHRLYKRAVGKEMKRIIAEGFMPDAGYAHFWRSGIAGAYALPEPMKMFIACGESIIKSELTQEARDIIPRLGGVISVSGKNRDDCIKMYNTPGDLITVLPNGVNGDVFRPLTASQRAAQRKRLGIGEDELAVVFVGWFNERKGVKRVQEALDGLEHVKVMYIGSGDLTPQGDNIVFCGRVEHNELPMYLGAADVFVLPTLAEGCCNAIVEAMACGLPVISSVGKFNDDLLSDENSIRVDPMNVSAIREAVLTLKQNDALRHEMGEKALTFAQGLDVGQRARKIKAFIDERI